MGQSFEHCGLCKVRALMVFVTEAATPVTTAWFLRMVQSLPFKVYPHMLRDSTGYKLADDGTILGPSLTTWATATCRARRATPPWRWIVSRGSGRTDVGAPSNTLCYDAGCGSRLHWIGARS